MYSKQILDVGDVGRPEFGGGDPELATRLDDLPRGRPIYVICQTGRRSYRSAQFLEQVGFEDVASVEGGVGAYRARGCRIERGERIGREPRIAESDWTHAGGRLEVVS